MKDLRNDCAAIQIKAKSYKGYKLHLCENSNGYYVAIRKIFEGNSQFVESTPYRNDQESALEAGKANVDYLIEQNRRDEKHGLYGDKQDISN